ncbi:hypothetical protein ACHAWO_007347 [Cyclotella atomus]|uniref:Uncharacterized protein n=1 Tax=Cyclotella atomus TaxID=382360 RepID=A0ABD3P7T9_9STRA
MKQELSHCLLIPLLISVLTITAAPVSAFGVPSSAILPSVSKAFTDNREVASRLFESQNEESDKVAIGSSEYYQGFMNRSLNEEPSERVTGDAILGPTFKFVGGFAAILAVLTFGFLASNGLI